MRRDHESRPKARAGFTIIEVMVAMIILTVGLLGLASTSGFVAKQMGRGSYQSVAASIAQSRFDSLASVACPNLPASGSVRRTSTQRSVTETYTISDSNDTKFVIDSISFPGRTRALEYRSYISCRD